MKRLIFFIIILLPYLSSVSHAQISSSREILPSGEILLTQELIVNAPIDQVWDAFTTEEDWKKWVTPEVAIDLKINGSIRSHYTAGAQLGDSGTIELKILFYIPYQQLVMQAKLGDAFPEDLRSDAPNLFSQYWFEALGKDETKISLTGIYPNKEEWNQLLAFFERGNAATLEKLQHFLSPNEE